MQVFKAGLKISLFFFQDSLKQSFCFWLNSFQNFSCVGSLADIVVIFGSAGFDVVVDWADDDDIDMTATQTMTANAMNFMVDYEIRWKMEWVKDSHGIRIVTEVGLIISLLWQNIYLVKLNSTFFHHGFTDSNWIVK